MFQKVLRDVFGSGIERYNNYTFGGKLYECFQIWVFFPYKKLVVVDVFEPLTKFCFDHSKIYYPADAVKLRGDACKGKPIIVPVQELTLAFVTNYAMPTTDVVISLYRYHSEA